MAWNWMRLKTEVADGGVFPTYGEGGMTYEDAHAYVQDMLNALAAFDPTWSKPAAVWKRGAQDDSVYHGPVTFTLYEYPDGEDPYYGAVEWLAGYVEIMRGAGWDINVHQRPQR